ncbi:MAG: protein phosphatase 2C domain-containing protein [Actinomycetota bacterium]|nr:protein phosphatase 2C domain-containing protein [Actinomycetota bacterium]
MSDTGNGQNLPGPRATPGPTLSFAFNLEKVPGHGEDSDPILRDGPDLGLVAVFDGMGGAGGTVYETPDGPRTGAYLASRIARQVVERRMLELLEPDWNLNGEAAALDLQRSIRAALTQALHDLKAPASGLRSRLLRALPTTMALVALQRTQSGGSTWAGHVLWAGDSRAYVIESTGIRQLSTDDLRDSNDAMQNLSRDSVVSNAMSADTDFHVNYRRVELEAPFLVVCATDGCFGYVQTPMHFEHLLLDELARARSAQAWSEALQQRIGLVTGDDAAMSLLGVGAQFRMFQTLLAPRLAELATTVVAPLDALAQAVEQAENDLQRARTRQVETTSEVWSRYKTEYERYLRDQPPPDDDEGNPGTEPVEPAGTGSEPATEASS